MDREQFLVLIQKYLAGEASLEEEQLLLNFYGSFQDSDVWDERTMGVKEQIEAKMLSRIQAHVAGTKTEKPVVKLWPRIAAVAAAVAMVVFGVWFFNSDREILKQVQDDVVANDIAPGKNGATITLANGKVIQLSDAKSGVVIGEDLKYNDNTAVVDPSSRGNERSPGHATSRDLSSLRSVEMTASTTKGQTYIFTLLDGTKVWLNADSKITFKNQFIGRTRHILLEGEAYFEVAKNKKSPFVVKTREQEVMVLGTHFNINSYADESSVKTTLFEGSVNVSRLLTKVGVNKDLGGKTLKPGQQSILNRENFKVIEANMDEAIAWKNNEFMFESQSIESIMKMVERWYDVEVIYTGNKPAEKYSGTVSRFDNVSSVLRILESSGGVHFKIEGRKIYVSN
ncbi:FecR family protein [Pedobacter frigoris]|uniref:FecR family protein n=1 Tax=Pedobacter frigoris TaxID=2571272 RepID=UPI0029304702|nr:FecR domain-containing protein [Pedobacter frigoris]